MSFPFPRDLTVGSGPMSDVMDDLDSLSDVLGPLVAGARARGVADACELLGIAAVLVDGTGRVLHAGGRAHRALSPMVRIVEDHLVGADSRCNDALQHLVARAIDASASASESDEIAIRSDGVACEIRIRALRFPSGIGNNRQLLKAILVISERTS